LFRPCPRFVGPGHHRDRDSRNTASEQLHRSGAHGGPAAHGRLPLQSSSSIDTVDAEQARAVTNDGSPTHWLLSPTAWASLRKIKTGTGYASSLLGAGTSDTVKMLLDLPVLVTPAMTASTGMLVDKNAIVSAVGSVLVAQSEHAFFSSDSIALRCTWRFGQNVVKPNRIGKFTVAAEGS